MNYDSLLEISNTSDSDTYLFAYNSQRWVIKPGSRAYLPFEAVVRSMGDPRSGPNPLRIQPEGGGHAISIPSRAEEIKRLSVMYGVYAEDVNTVNPDTGKSLTESIPQIVAHNMDDQTPIIFPVSDPFCAEFSPTETDASTVAVMQRQLDKMRRQMQAMEAVMAGSDPVDLSHPSALPADAEVDEDTPQPLARPRASNPPKSATG